MNYTITFTFIMHLLCDVYQMCKKIQIIKVTFFPTVSSLFLFSPSTLPSNLCPPFPMFLLHLSLLFFSGSLSPFLSLYLFSL